MNDSQLTARAKQVIRDHLLQIDHLKSKFRAKALTKEVFMTRVYHHKIAIKAIQSVFR